MTAPSVNLTKNRNRDPFSFANINLLGPCNADCFFCLGKDLDEELQDQDQTKLHYKSWPNFERFLQRCWEEWKIRKIYITGQTTDSLVYQHLAQLVGHLRTSGFEVGLRTNGYRALRCMDTINNCQLSTGYTIHSLDPRICHMICNRPSVPEWEQILTFTQRPRVQIVVNRCNRHEIWDLLRFVAQYPNVRYIQLRRISTDRRQAFLAPDIAAYEELYTQIREIFPLKERLWEDAEVFEIFGKDVCCWRTTKTSVNSVNYFTDGTISDEYFIVEGYLKNCERLQEKKDETA